MRSPRTAPAPAMTWKGSGMGERPAARRDARAGSRAGSVVRFRTSRACCSLTVVRASASSCPMLKADGVEQPRARPCRNPPGGATSGRATSGWVPASWRRLRTFLLVRVIRWGLGARGASLGGPQFARFELLHRGRRELGDDRRGEPLGQRLVERRADAGEDSPRALALVRLAEGTQAEIDGGVFELERIARVERGPAHGALLGAELPLDLPLSREQGGQIEQRHVGDQRAVDDVEGAGSNLAGALQWGGGGTGFTGYFPVKHRLGEIASWLPGRRDPRRALASPSEAAPSPSIVGSQRLI